MKDLLKFVHIMCFVFLISSCTSDSIQNTTNTNDSLVQSQSMQPQFNDPCIDQNPVTRVINNGTTAFDFQVIDSEGVILVDIPNIPPSTTTSWANFAEGEVLFSVSNNAALVNDDKILLQMDACMAYEIEIDGNNEIVSYTPTIL
ncbi:hypothetical protein [uncultured Winogradskyella sp.]|uniref:hypothetical protein n=1 Tax=uncultured Winogradskyella sp. TaxID=395353 RepID=UPI002636E109|nr:hypothetical protein [uncultured Winogradskyella sp.]